MPLVKCHHCGSEFQRQLNQIKRSKFLFCSPKCKSDNPDFNALAGKTRGDAQRFGGAGKTYVKMNGRHMHRVIAEEKLGRPLLPKEVVHHIDGNRRNNDPENLEITTQSAHIRIHLPAMRKIKEERGTNACGETSGMSKLTNSDVLEIRALREAGETSKIIAVRFGVNSSTIQKIINGRTWKHLKDAATTSI